LKDVAHVPDLADPNRRPYLPNLVAAKALVNVPLLDRMSNCVVGSVGLRLPRSIIAEHGVEGSDHFSHDGDDNDLGFLVGVGKTIGEGLESGIVSACAEGCVEGLGRSHALKVGMLPRVCAPCIQQAFSQQRWEVAWPDPFAPSLDRISPSTNPLKTLNPEIPWRSKVQSFPAAPPCDLITVRSRSTVSSEMRIVAPHFVARLVFK
jgi:hypothetical protein